MLEINKDGNFLQTKKKEKKKESKIKHAINEEKKKMKNDKK